RAGEPRGDCSRVRGRCSFRGTVHRRRMVVAARPRRARVGPARTRLVARASVVARSRHRAPAGCIRAAAPAPRGTLRRFLAGGLARMDGGHALMSESRIGADVRRTMALRTMCLQATWNYERQQGVGWAWALAPALERLYPDAATRSERLAEHTAYFNTQ